MAARKVMLTKRRSLDESLEAYAQRTGSPCTCGPGEPTHTQRRSFWSHREWCLFHEAYQRWRAYPVTYVGLKHVSTEDEPDKKQVA